MSGVDPRLREHLKVGKPSDGEFVAAAFGLVLRRPPDGEARERALAKLADGTLSRASLLQELVTAGEFERVRQLDDMIAFARGARARGERPRHLQAPPATDERLVEVPWVLSRLRPGRLLEVGYAFAEPAYIAALVEASPDELVGVDLAQAEVPGFETVVADARALPFPDASFDAIVSAYAIDHLSGTDIPKTLAEAARVLRPGGEFLLEVMYPDRWMKFAWGPMLLHGASAARMRAAWPARLEAAGFKVVEVGTAPITLYLRAVRPQSTQTSE